MSGFVKKNNNGGLAISPTRQQQNVIVGIWRVQKNNVKNINR